MRIVIWAIRKGDWLYINDSTGGHRTLPEFFQNLTGYTDFTTENLLFNMAEDPEQRINLFEDYPDKSRVLDSLIQVYRESVTSVDRKKGN